MGLTVAAVGRARSGPLVALFEDYASRITAARAFGPLALREVEERRKLPPAELRSREAALLRGVLPKGATVVALDAGGEPLSSAAFAAKLGRWRDQGVADLAFAIGGADGLDAAFRAEADAVLSLGAMTWPHLLARVMLAEQLYRAVSILQGHPYHR